MNYTEEQVKEKFNSLPNDVKEAISSVDTTNVIINIGDKYSLQIDLLGELVDETGLLMLGFTHPDEFVGNLKNRLNVSKDLAENLAKDINDQILIKIRASLRDIHSEVTDDKGVDDGQAHSTFPIEGIIKEPVEEDKQDSKTFGSGETELSDDELNLERKQILEEIENPEKSEVEIDRNENDELKNMNMVMQGQPKDLGNPQHTDIIETKLKTVVQVPIKEKDISEKTDESGFSTSSNINNEEKKDYEIDPYREPIE